MTEELREKINSVRSYMGFAIIDYNNLENDYHNSWDQQIPIYAKIRKELKELVKNRNVADYLFNYYTRVKENYLKAVYNNDTKAGFEIVVDIIRHLKQYK